jgi:2-oxoglutarate ferredoxin oxidoreductase subunit delta
MSQGLNLKGYRYVQLKNDTCTGCINCAIVCPDSAITVYRQVRQKDAGQAKSATPKVATV